MKRGVDVVMLFIATCFVHALLFFALFAVFLAAAAPIGSGKQEVFAMYGIPFFLLVLGWIQGRDLFVANLSAGVIMWIWVWYFPMRYDAAHALGTLMKEQSWDATTSSLIAIIVCTIVAGVRNGYLRWHGKEVFLNIPLRGKIVLWA